MDLNVVTITGRLADDPKPYATGNGGDVTMLRIAVGRPKRPGQQRSEADFVDVAAWDEQAKLAAKYLAKGLRVGVTGRLQQRTWETPEGKRSRLQVVAGQLHFIDFKEQVEQSPRHSNGGVPTAAAAQAAAPSTDAEVAESHADAPQPVIEVVVQADGGARGNPGPAGFGVVVMTPAGEVLAELAEPIGRATNNVAEYQAVIAGLERAGSLAGPSWLLG
jgi:single-strand DNA-binding protein